MYPDFRTSVAATCLLVATSLSATANAELPAGLPKPNNATHPGNAAFLNTFSALAAKHPQMVTALAAGKLSNTALPPAPVQAAPAADANTCKNSKPQPAMPVVPVMTTQADYTSNVPIKERLKGAPQLPALDKNKPKTWVFGTVQGAPVAPPLPSGKAAPVTVWPLPKAVASKPTEAAPTGK
ncbi:MAG: hypothetical protein FJ100_17450 [Deltaproteobacteria bacterium]|nr:hypothetical protein [Deltaproteobacteria bacterium]